MNTRILYSETSEQSVLGGLILDNRSWDFIEDLITEDDFYYAQHKTIFTVVSQMLSTNRPVDWLTLCEKLKETNDLDNVGGEIYIVELLKNTPTAVNIKTYALIVKRHSQERQLRNAVYTILDMIDTSHEDLFEEAEKLVLQVRERKTGEPDHIRDELNALFESIHEQQDSQGKLLGLSTGYVDLDKITRGLKKSNLVVLAARPAIGKSMIALNIVEHVGIVQQEPVLMFSLEMSKEELKLRMLSSLSKVSHENIQDGKLSLEEETRLFATIENFNRAKIWIDDSGGLTLSDIKAKCRRTKRKHGLSLVVVDYLGLINGQGENETARIGEISRGLKELAKELNVPVLAIAQLNRAVEARENKRPMMADLRQSGQIEQDADLIMFIYREVVYNEHTPAKNIAEVIISKNRSGRIGKVFLTFDGDKCRFDSYFGDPPVYEEKKKQTKGYKPNAYKAVNDIYTD